MARRPLPQWITAPDLAAHLGVTPKTVRVWIRQGIVKASQVCSPNPENVERRRTKRGTWRIERGDLEAFMARFRASGGALR